MRHLRDMRRNDGPGIARTLRSEQTADVVSRDVAVKHSAKCRTRTPWTNKVASYNITENAMR
jgi:hypothetical protein